MGYIEFGLPGRRRSERETEGKGRREWEEKERDVPFLTPQIALFPSPPPPPPLFSSSTQTAESWSTLLD